MQNKDLWLKVKSPDEYDVPYLISFNPDDTIQTYLLKTTHQEGVLDIEKTRQRFPDPIKKEILNNEIICFHSPVKKLLMFEDRTETEDGIMQDIYQRIVPTKTGLSPTEIQSLKYMVEYKKERIKIIFNTPLDIPVMQEINKRMNREGHKLLLERFNETLLVASHDNGQRKTVYPILYIDRNKIILSGFPLDPFTATGAPF